MKYILDTNICVYLLNGNEVLKKKIKTIGLASISITHTVLAELFFGAYNSSRIEENIKRIEEFKKNLVIFSESVESSRLFGKIKSDLKVKGKIIDDFDILIASIALANSCIIITNNTNHFKTIEGLKVKNWLKK